MIELLKEKVTTQTDYFDKRSKIPKEEYFQLLSQSSTLYVGNLPLCTREETIYEWLSRAGVIKRIIMGQNKEGTFTGFCFVEYLERRSAEFAMTYLNQMNVDGRLIRLDWDIGFSEGREFGRGKNGIQVRDCARDFFDPDRPNVQVNMKRKNYYQNEEEGKYRKKRHY